MANWAKIPSRGKVEDRRGDSFLKRLQRFEPTRLKKLLKVDQMNIDFSTQGYGATRTNPVRRIRGKAKKIK